MEAIGPTGTPGRGHGRVGRTAVSSWAAGCVLGGPREQTKHQQALLCRLVVDVTTLRQGLLHPPRVFITTCSQTPAYHWTCAVARTPSRSVSEHACLYRRSGSSARQRASCETAIYRLPRARSIRSHISLCAIVVKQPAGPCADAERCPLSHSPPLRDGAVHPAARRHWTPSSDVRRPLRGCQAEHPSTGRCPRQRHHLEARCGVWHPAASCRGRDGSSLGTTPPCAQKGSTEPQTLNAQALPMLLCSCMAVTVLDAWTELR